MLGVAVVVDFNAAECDGFWHDDVGDVDRWCDGGDGGNELDGVDVDGTGCRNNDGFVGDDNTKEDNDDDSAGPVWSELSLLLLDSHL